MRESKWRLQEKGHIVIDFDTKILNKLFDAYCGIILASTKTEMHGEYKLPEYGMSSDLDIIPESIWEYVAPILKKFGLNREAYSMVWINKTSLQPYIEAQIKW